MRRALIGLLGLTTACGFSASPAPAGPGDDAPARDAAISDDAGGDAPIANPAGQRRKLITIDHTKVTGGTLQDFPVWIDLDDSDVATRAQANGSDLSFTAADGSALEHELAIADRANHHFAAWVRIPSLSDKGDTTLYVHYGDPAVTHSPNPKDVFKASFAAVWHLDDSDLSKPIVDATGNHAGTPHLTATQSAPGKLGKGLVFNGTSGERIEFTNPLTGNNPHTISVWVAQGGNTGHTAAIINMGNTGTGNARFLHGRLVPPPANNGALGGGFYTRDFAPTPAVSLDNAGMTYLVWVFEGPNRKNRLYRNGVPLPGDLMVAPGVNTTGTAGCIGDAPVAYGPDNNAYNGTIDELRIATATRTDGWIATEYANQSAPTTFYTVGPELAP